MIEPSYQITREAGAVRLSGDLDINAREELRDVLVAAAQEDGAGALVVDFDDTAFLDSEAMGALIEGFLAARAAGVKMSIVNAHGLVHRVLDVSGVLEMFETGQT
ncbi:STAS domain-containing protein [Nucisporomicrobium flavum]|uniref:STAS domain-containing protein n=1 Tax=Nucisporomicrobium flavum TaxID=2785915 RepID=UPI0018F78F6D|nr:STAS domain-containing protein [Nucisporomicrobium flavum]